MKTAAEINVERIEEILISYAAQHRWSARGIARAIVEAFDVLRPHQQTMERDGTSKPIPEKLPWEGDYPAPWAWHQR